MKKGVSGAGTLSPTKTTEATLPTQHPKENAAGVSLCLTDCPALL